MAPAALLGYGLYLQYGQGQDPCPLCLVQRAFFLGVGVMFLIGALIRYWRTFWALLAGLFAIGGLATAGRQVWLQHLPKDKVPACGPDLAYMLQNFPLLHTIRKLFEGSGQCAEVTWRFLGLSIAEWSLLWFIGLLIYAAWLATRSLPSRRVAA